MSDENPTDMPKITEIRFSKEVRVSSELHPTQSFLHVPGKGVDSCEGDLRITIPRERILRYEIKESEGRQSLFVVYKRSTGQHESMEIGYVDPEDLNCLKALQGMLNHRIEASAKES